MSNMGSIPAPLQVIAPRRTFSLFLLAIFELPNHYHQHHHRRNHRRHHQAEYKRLLHTSVVQRLDSNRLMDSRIFSNELVKAAPTLVHTHFGALACTSTENAERWLYATLLPARFFCSAARFWTIWCSKLREKKTFFSRYTARLDAPQSTSVPEGPCTQLIFHGTITQGFAAHVATLPEVRRAP